MTHDIELNNMNHTRLTTLFTTTCILGLFVISPIVTSQYSKADDSLKYVNEPSTQKSMTSSKVLNLACLVPYTKTWPFGKFGAAGIIVGLEEIQQRHLLPDYNITFVWRDSWCQPRQSMKVTVEMWQKSPVLHGLIGEGCSSACEKTGLLAAVWNLPFVAIRCLSSLLSNKKAYPTFARVVGRVQTTAPLYNAVAAYMNWDRIGIIRDENAVYRIMAEATANEMERDGRKVYLRGISATVSGGIINERNYDVLRNVMLELKRLVRVIYIFAYADDMRSALIIAKEEGLMNGDYAFAGSSFGATVNKKYPYRPDLGPELYNGMLNRENWTPTSPEWDDFSLKVINRFSDPTFDGWPRLQLKDDPFLVSLYAGMIHDAVLVWAYAMNKTLEQGYTPEDGLKVAENMFNLSFMGITGPVKLDGVGDRQPNYEIDIIQNGSLVKIFEWRTGENVLRKIYNPDSKDDWTGLLWPGNATEPPLGRPECGWKGEFCAQQGESNGRVVSISVAATIATFLLIAMLLGVYFFRKLKWEVKLKEATSCLVTWSDITDMTMTRQDSATTVESTFENHGKAKFIDTVCIKNDIAAVKKLGSGNFDISKDILIDLTIMKDIKQENINGFIGLCLEPNHRCILMIYAQHGSLQDVLLDDSMVLTWDFKISLAMDIANGVHYLHQSDIGCHGHLTSTNCVVDGRWTCKITDYGLKTIKCKANSLPKNAPEGEVDAVSLMWSAPELLRSLMPSLGTKKGDAFSFGIIVQEICLQDVPYSANVPFPTPHEITSGVKDGVAPVFRPHVPLESCNRQWQNLMTRCWSEDPDSRPDFQGIKSMLKAINGGVELNLVDSMIRRLENHAKNLEDIVLERTKELQEEKMKVENLLIALLPRSVAESLKLGRPVDPEFFDECTVFFSDVVGFTRISAVGTPMDVIRMLNMMYTLLDDVSSQFDVYKVATIGDAYFVVSGVPIRCSMHASEICRMALSLLDAAKRINIPHIKDETLQLRIGVHSGPVVAGVTGIKMPRYLLFGDTVDIASKMESSGQSMNIQISQSTVDLIWNPALFELELRGPMDVKGQGIINTYWLR